MPVLPMVTRPLIAALMVAAAAMSPAAQAQDDISKQLINTPDVKSWNVYGAGQTHKFRKDPKVQGGGALLITIPKATPNVWDIGASTPISGAIKTGDNLMLIIWARHEGEGEIDIPAVIQQSQSPYGAIVSDKLVVGPQWQMVVLKGVSRADYKAGEANAALQLGGTTARIDLGPAFVLNQGQ